MVVAKLARKSNPLACISYPLDLLLEEPLDSSMAAQECPEDSFPLLVSFSVFRGAAVNFAPSNSCLVEVPLFWMWLPGILALRRSVACQRRSEPKA